MPTIKVAVYLYPNADALDFTGPIEILSTSGPAFTPCPFEVTTFAHHERVASASPALVYTPNASFASVADSLQDYDVLVVPGGLPATITDLVETDEGRELAALLARFVATPPRSETGKRVLLSVCTGAVLLAAAGVLQRRSVTTHHWALDLLQDVADKAAGGKSDINIVTRDRWVDAGLTEAGVRIINAAGVTSGIDASLWVVGHFAGEEQKKWTAECAEFEPRDAAWGVF